MMKFLLLLCLLTSAQSDSVTSEEEQVRNWSKNFLALDWTPLWNEWRKDYRGTSQALNDAIKAVKDDSCAQIPLQQRLDCFPDSGSNEQACVARGCCWLSAETEKGDNIPWCFYSNAYQQSGYQMGSLVTINGTFKQIEATRKQPSFMPEDVMNIKLDFSYETNDRLRIKIYDPNNDRYEVPQKYVERPVDGATSNGTGPTYKVDVSENGQFNFKVTRQDGSLIMDAIPQNFIYANQFLQMSFNVQGAYLYGLGEHRGALAYDLTSWSQVAMWARDQPPCVGCNLYSSHPMYVIIQEDGIAHGVVLMNSNAMDVTIQPSPIITWRTIGGILDFYVLTGPAPKDVIRQYFNLIGHPMPPPYWGLGFQLCKYGYGSSEETWKVVNRTRAIGFPQEVQWNDIDYMDQHMDFTYDKDKFGSLPDMVADLHAYNQSYVMILDPGISDVIDNEAFKQGNDLKVWITKDGSTPLEGQVWPGFVYYPDFTSSNSSEFWYNQFKSYQDQIPFDGVWIDMNEPSDFVGGSTSGCPQDKRNDPPYTPTILDRDLKSKTICPSAVQEEGYHYDLHNLYGHTEGIASNHALTKLKPGERPFIISRSSFMSSGRYMGKWTGDNNADWDNMRYSIAATININIFGISFTGADICGFGGTTTEELCTRWMQMGSFYTFMRNHNMINSPDQDPAVFSPEAQQNMKKYVMLRYKYLPYLNTELYNAYQEGDTVLTALAFAFPRDPNTYNIDTQFMWGANFMIAPVLSQGSQTVNTYFPAGTTWYDVEEPGTTYNGGHTQDISAPLSKLPVFVKSGSIIISQQPELTLTRARTNPFEMEVFLSQDSQQLPQGDLFWDNGVSDLRNKQYTYMKFSLQPLICGSGWGILNKIVENNYKQLPKMASVSVYGVKETPLEIKLGHKILDFVHDHNLGSLKINLEVDLTQEFSILITFKNHSKHSLRCSEEKRVLTA